MKTHPYKQFEHTPAWNVIESAIAALVLNDDLLVKTGDEYIVGVIVKAMYDHSVRCDLPLKNE